MKSLVVSVLALMTGSGLAAASVTNPSEGKLTTPFGKPTYIQRLYYTKMYDQKPFRDAVLFYYDNGVYKIISPGEEHYGTYFVEGSFGNPKYRVHFISLPSADWDNTSAYHVLEFDKASGRYTQQAISPTDDQIPPQHGNFTTSTNTIPNPVETNWENGKDLGVPPHR